MKQRFTSWLEGIFSNLDINKLIAVGAVAGLFVWFLGNEMLPFFIALLIAYLLEGCVQHLERFGVKRSYSIALVILLTLTIICVSLYLLPLLALQLRGVANDLPNIVTLVTSASHSITAYLPAGFEAPTEEEITTSINNSIADIGKFILGHSLGLAINVFSVFLYLVLMPLLVFFLLKDKTIILQAAQRYMPRTPIFAELWASVDEQFGSYVRGKFIEGGIIGLSSWLVLNFWEANYAFSLAALIGLSVFVPFVGAIAVTIPVVILVYVQFGDSSAFFWIIGLYALIQALDGQLLVPLLFSEVVKLHPVAIFVAIIFFGNLWGIWGVFFAIPLASIVKSLLMVIDARRKI
ncbi:MAG: AI-2E family transporter [Gammaproteobacteria bacterium WSBS_2016_MAG_OTU1]